MDVRRDLKVHTVKKDCLWGKERSEICLNKHAGQITGLLHSQLSADSVDNEQDVFCLFEQLENRQQAVIKTPRALLQHSFPEIPLTKSLELLSFKFQNS